MITTEEAFETYRKRLELSETERKNTIKRHEEVRGVIRSSYVFGIRRWFDPGREVRKGHRD